MGSRQSSSRRANGEGSIGLRPNGLSWYGALEVAGKRKYVYGKTRSVVVEKLDALRGKARSAGRLPASGRMTVGQFVSDWLEQKKPQIRATTQDAYATIVKMYIIPEIGDVRLSRLNAAAIASFYARLGERFSRRRCESVHAVLHRALRDAVQQGLAASNASDAVEPPRRERTEHTLWNREQVSRFVSAVAAGRGGHFGTLYGLLLASGLRLGEGLGLEWCDIDWDAGTVTVRRQLTEVRGRAVPCMPKTRHGFRVVSLPEWGMSVLRAQKARQSSLEQGMGADWSAGEAVFTSLTGTIPGRRSIRRAWDKFEHELCLPHIPIHGLRHAHASWLLDKGVSIAEVSRRLGHASVSITTDTYTHHLKHQDAAACRALDLLT